ncbi:50S ribosomal protein L6 [bacterium]|nr:50S ribosomal protein L6 [bacterium]
MSRIGKQPINVPSQAKVQVQGQTVRIEGPKGTLQWTVPAPITVAVKEGKLVTHTDRLDRVGKSRWGLSRSLLANMVQGVTDGYRKKLRIEGVGFRAAVQGPNLQLSLGYSHPVVYPIPKEIKVTVTDNTQIAVEGADKQLVGEVAACIRRFFPPEPYKGKGIRYEGEQVRRKAGKTVATGG